MVFNQRKRLANLIGEKMSIFEKKHSAIVSYKEQIIPVAWLKQMPSENIIPTNGNIMVSHSDGKLSRYIVDLLNQARETIVICSFLLAHQAIEDAIFQAAERGVRVYLMLASEVRLEKTGDDEFSQKCEQQHIAMLKRLAGKVMIRSAPHYHAKAVLIDALGGNNTAKGLLLTANITHEALERNEELAVILPRQAIEELVAFFRWGLFNQAKHQMLDNEKFTSIDKTDIPYPQNTRIMCFTSAQEKGILNHALALIEQAKQEIIVASFGFDEEHALIKKLCEKAEQGVLVTILARVRPSNMSALIQLKTAGAKIYGFKWLHAKALLVDGKQAMIMSANLQKRGLDDGFEIGICLNTQAIQELETCLNYFITQAQYHLAVNLAVGQCLGDIRIWENKQFQDLTILPEKQETLPDVIADCASDLSKAISLPTADWRKTSTQQVVYQWKVIAPTLPKQAKEVLWEEKRQRPAVGEKAKGQKDKKEDKFSKPQFDMIKHSYEPKVFRINQQEYIAINGEKQLQEAVKLREKQFKQAKIVLERVTI